MRPSTQSVLLGGLGLAIALLALGWVDYRAVSHDLRAALRAEADALHATIAAAARAQHAAAAQAEAALGHRLLENARLLALLDRREALTPDALEALVASSDLFRVMLFDAEGRRTVIGGDLPGRYGGYGRGGRGAGIGPPAAGRPQPGEGPPPGAGPPERATRLAQRLVSGEVAEIVSAPHTGRAGQERIAAGVRRSGGGAIILNAANRAAEELEQVYSFDPLLAEIASGTPRLAYVTLEEGERRIAHGPNASEVPPAGTVLERSGLIALADDRRAQLRVGMRLDEVKRAERRTLVRLSVGLSTVAALTVLALAFGSLKERYGQLSARHAEAEEALRRRDRLAAMGEMASTVAHEVRNPLNAIAMSAQRLAREHGGGPDAAEMRSLVDVIQLESARINATVQQFVEFARPRPLNLRAVNLDTWIEQIAAATRPAAAARDITLDSRAQTSATATIDSDQLHEAVDHLLRNALEATPPGGRVTLSATRRDGAWQIAVQDTGPGIPPDMLPRIFDLYFTTKPEGTGIGLAVAHQIATAHGGTITAEMGPSGGTSMTIHLPDDAARVQPEGLRS